MRDTGGQESVTVDEAGIAARGAALELPGEYELPPGDPVSHFGAGFAKTMVSNIFLTGLDPRFAADNTGYFTAPLADRTHVVDYEVDRARQSVTVLLDNGVRRTAHIHAGQGAVAIPLGAQGVAFKPKEIVRTPAEQRLHAWPDSVVSGDTGAELDAGKLAQALDLAFAEGMTAAVVVTHRGRVVAERYRDGIGPRTPLESWSMGKSVTATLIGILVEQGVYSLDQPAPIPQWQSAGDPRAQIRIRDILQMSSGLRFRAMQDPGYDATLGYPDHLYVYTGGINAFEFAASRLQQWPPGTVGRYRNVDPVLANYLIQLALQGQGEDYLSYPQRVLFDPLGIVDMTLETDPYGNFLLQGYEFGSARDWARLGNLYLNDGVWDGRRLLPEGWAKFVSSLAPAWRDDGRPIYGGFFWLNGLGAMPIPKDAYYMGGAGDQRTIIIPSHDLVVVRLGHYGGFPMGGPALNRALAKLMEAVPISKL